MCVCVHTYILIGNVFPLLYVGDANIGRRQAQRVRVQIVMHTVGHQLDKKRDGRVRKLVNETEVGCVCVNV